MKSRQKDNYVAWDIDEKKFPRNGNLQDQIQFLIGYGILAPSTHNTQPWEFIVVTEGATKQQLKHLLGGAFALVDGERAQTAGQLIDASGCRGLQVGGAQVSELHCNFLINRGGATAADIETLGENVRRRVRETSGVELEWEIERIGVAAPHD